MKHRNPIQYILFICLSFVFQDSIAQAQHICDGECEGRFNRRSRDNSLGELRTNGFRLPGG